jgi:hypothetical protein
MCSVRGGTEAQIWLKTENEGCSGARRLPKGAGKYTIRLVISLFLRVEVNLWKIQ